MSGEQITADIGHNLTIESLQDTDHYDSKQQSAAAGGSFTWGGGSGYISLSQDKMNSDYASVTDQSGLFAGNGGFDITVGDHTQLNGGVIASGASADKNRLDTGTLGWNDIHNEASYSVDSSSISMSSGGNSTSQFIGNMANAMLAGLNGDGSASSTTGSAIAGGTIVIRDQDAQKQDVASLNRDTDNAHSTLAPIFDAAKEQQRIDENRAIAQIGSQVADIVRTEGKIAAQEAAKEQLAREGKLPPTPEEGATQDKWDRYNETLANTDAYKAAMNEYGTGSNKQQAIQAITAAIQGLTGGDWSSAVAGAAAPYMAEFIKNNTAEGAERIISHALAGAIVAEMQGGNAAAGAAGAGLSAAGAKYIADQLYPGKDIKDLTEEEKQGVVALATLASGIAGGVVGGDVNSAIDGGKAGKNEVENNALNSADEKKRQDAKWSLPYLEGEKKVQAEKLVSDLDAKDEAFDGALDAACKGLSSDACRGMRQELAAMAESYDAQLDGQYIGTMASIYQEGAGKVDSLMWQYAKADAQAQKDRDIQIIATNWGVSVETASTLYTGMTGIHITAAIGGAVYGIKGESVPTVKGTTYPEGINFNINLKNHLTEFDGFSQKKGISGTHNLDEFNQAASANGVKILNTTPGPVEGISHVEYQIPAKDRAGNIVGYKAETFEKTVYDPKIFSDQRMLDLGQQAAMSGYKTAVVSGAREYTATAGGVKFQVFLDQKTGTVTNFFPVTK
ncbi:VENN motif pre-toxin domain-containing protein [Rahnella sp. SAP-29]|nr:VENN motif pre-toxin domain-containing protein [Rahnella laticis]